MEERYYFTKKEELLEFYKKICDAKGEGIIIKLVEKSYEYGSRKNWWKVKPVFEMTMEVVGFELGEGRHKGVIGALLVKNKDGTINCKVGSGLTDEDRATIKENIDKIKFIDVAYNEISQNKDGDKSLRFPRFLKIRDDKNEAD